jgi:ATP-dependent exoDNAse (exonuclease V) beta subunit
LLYVALTRGKAHLVIAGRHHYGNRSHPNVLLNMLLRALGWNGEPDPANVSGLADYVELIPPYPVETLKRRVHHTRISPDAARRVYENARHVTLPTGKHEYTATDLNQRYVKSMEIGEERSLPKLPCDGILSQREIHDEFGTLTHLFIQILLEGRKAETDPRIRRAENSLRKKVTKRELGILMDDARFLAESFSHSQLASRIRNSTEFESELSFLYSPRESDVLLRGQLDLLFREEDHLTVVDFKSDSVVRLGEYDLQMSVYRSAASEWSTEPVSVLLVYLRSLDVLEPELVKIPDWLFGEERLVSGP